MKCCRIGLTSKCLWDSFHHKCFKHWVAGGFWYRILNLVPNWEPINISKSNIMAWHSWTLLWSVKQWQSGHFIVKVDLALNISEVSNCVQFPPFSQWPAMSRTRQSFHESHGSQHVDVLIVLLDLWSANSHIPRHRHSCKFFSLRWKAKCCYRDEVHSTTCTRFF